MFGCFRDMFLFCLLCSGNIVINQREISKMGDDNVGAEILKKQHLR